jgi:NDP-sugar pyrophosphorylase family protein
VLPDHDPVWTIERVPAAILAGGLATRLRPITHTVPKAMVEVAGKPFVDHQLELLARRGMRRVVLCLGYRGEQVVEHVGDGSRHGLQVQYSHDGERLLGTGGALRRALPLLGEVFWVVYGDSYLDIDYEAVLAHFRAGPGPALMTVVRNANRWDRSNAVFRDGRLLCYDKRQPGPDMTHIDYGASLLRRSAVEQIPEGEAHDLADLYNRLVAEGQMVGYEVHERFHEIGSPQGLAETALLLDQTS